MASRPVSLVQAVASVYNLHPQLSPGDSLFGEFMEQLRRYPERSRRVFSMIRQGQALERAAHAYMLRRRYVRGNHKFGHGSILSESHRHRQWREEHARAERRRRASLEARLKAMPIRSCAPLWARA